MTHFTPRGTEPMSAGTHQAVTDYGPNTQRRAALLTLRSKLETGLANSSSDSDRHFLRQRLAALEGALERQSTPPTSSSGDL